MPSSDYNVPARIEDERDEVSLKFMGLATSSGPHKYTAAASIAVDEGGRMHFLSLSDSELRKLTNDATEYLRSKAGLQRQREPKGES